MALGSTAHPNYLPQLPGLREGWIRGRSPYEGTQRGWGLQNGDVREHILQDELYLEACAAAGNRSIVWEPNRMNLFLILKFFLGRIPFGHIVEYGTYRGGNAIFMAHVVNALYPGMKIFALDTFEGMPETDKDIDAHNSGDFCDVDLDEIKACITSTGLQNIELVKGRFEGTHSRVMAAAGQVALAHIDCDIRSAVAFSYDAAKPFMVEGGYYVFDDACFSSCAGATEAVEDLLIRRDGLNCEQIWPHFVFRKARSTSDEGAHS